MSYRQVAEEFRGRMFPKVWDRELLRTWDEPDVYAGQIQSMAASLSRQEVLDYYNLEEYELSEYDYWFFDANFKRGRSLAVQVACGELFKNMSTNHAAAMGYLQRFGDNLWASAPKSTDANLREIKLILDDGA